MDRMEPIGVEGEPIDPVSPPGNNQTRSSPYRPLGTPVRFGDARRNQLEHTVANPELRRRDCAGFVENNQFQ